MFNFYLDKYVAATGTSMATSLVGQFLHTLAICQNLVTCEVSPTNTTYLSEVGLLIFGVLS
jgi:hypothetical protein